MSPCPLPLYRGWSADLLSGAPNAQAPGVGPDGTDAVRPYTPISENCMLGKFQLLIKRYEGAAVSQYMYRLKLGDKVRFKHIKFNVKKQYPFPGVRTVRATPAASGPRAGSRPPVGIPRLPIAFAQLIHLFLIAVDLVPTCRYLWCVQAPESHPSTKLS
eukprot:scaffold243950_cov35-Tisochrysis_lutea.AAC.1